MNLLKIGVLIVAASAISGCSSAAKEPLALFLQALSEPDVAPAQLNTAFVGMLASESRARVKARAALLSQELGVTVREDEVLRVDGLPRGLRLGSFEVAAGDGTVEVAFANLDKGTKLMASPATWQVVREEDQLRLILPANAFDDHNDSGESAR